MPAPSAQCERECCSLECRPGSDTAFVVARTPLSCEFEDGRCYGTRGCRDFSAGQQVVVKDEVDKVVALGKTGPGIESGFHECEFEFTVDDIPERPFYAVELGKRGSLMYSREELDR